MLNFASDYTEGALPEILEALLRTNLEQLPGYGDDVYSKRAKEKILKACGCPDGDAFLLVGGTQTNSTVLASLLMPYEGVICADTGHIACHEAGAIEHQGHKVITLPGKDGLLLPGELEHYLTSFYTDDTYTHMVQPGAVYISYPTEWGTVYSLDQLKALRSLTEKYHLKLFVDGARLGYALAGPSCDLDLPVLAVLCDAFYIGGTKVGALCGEAVVFPKGAPRSFFTTVKQNGALLAKGRLTGVQFDTLLTDDLYMRAARHALNMAEELKQLFRDEGVDFFMETPTNQQFVTLPNPALEKLKEHVLFSMWGAPGEEKSVVRFCTSWATTKEQLESLREYLHAALH